MDARGKEEDAIPWLAREILLPLNAAVVAPLALTVAGQLEASKHSRPEVHGSNMAQHAAVANRVDICVDLIADL